jgi:hypothetical protein
MPKPTKTEPTAKKPDTAKPKATKPKATKPTAKEQICTEFMKKKSAAKIPVLNLWPKKPMLVKEMTTKPTTTTTTKPNTTPTATETATPALTPTYTMDPADALRAQKLRSKCVTAEYKATHFFRGWLDRRSRLFLLRHIEEYQFFLQMELEINEMWLKDMTCKPLRKPLLVVVRLQRDVAFFERKFNEANDEEKRLDAEFWELVNKYKKNNE